MTFAREKRLLLGVLAFLVVLPLPWNEPRPAGVIGWPSLLLYLLFLVVFLLAAHRDSGWRLPTWAMNLLGLAYIPFLLWEVRAVGATNLVRPMIHLLMFGLLVKLFSMNKAGEEWQIAILTFFIFVGAMATSVHPLILVYLISFVSLALTLLFRFVHYDLLAKYPAVSMDAALLPVRGLLLGCAALTFLVSIPLFALMPRLRAPYVLGRGLALTSTNLSTGFQDEVSLDGVGKMRTNAGVALRFKMEDKQSSPPIRYRGAIYDTFEANAWKRSSPARVRLRPESRTFYRLAQERPQSKMRIWLEPLGTKSLILPTQAVTVEMAGWLYRDSAGTVSLGREPSGLTQYRVGLSAAAVSQATPPSPDPDAEPTLDRRGISKRIEVLAERLVGGQSAARKAALAERHLRESYEYSLASSDREVDDPIDEFLFRSHSGHSEHFATAMVLMLRSQGIPARFVAGFMGAELNPLEDYFVVRQSNAHVWVEAYLPGEGWVTFDPTPAAGRPGRARPSLALMLRQAWDYLEFRWDRYVIAYGTLDQLGLLVRLRRFWETLKKDLGPAASPAEPASMPTADPRPPFELGRLVLPQSALWVLGGSLVLLLLASWLRRGRFSATRAYRDLRVMLSRRDPEVSEATAPMTLYTRLASRFPKAAPPAQSLIHLYLRESYAGHSLAEGESLQARRALRQLRSELRRGTRHSQSAVS